MGSCIKHISSIKTVDVQDSHGFWGFQLEDLQQFLKIKLNLYFQFIQK
jgi:hypothetical protein